MLLLYIHYFFYSNFLFKANIKGNKILYYSGKSLNQITFRLPKNFDSNWFSTVLIFKGIFSNLFKNNTAEFFSDSNSVFFDSSPNSKEIRKNYLKQLIKEDNIGSIYKNELLIFSGILNTLQIVVFSILFLPFIFIFSLFKADKKHLPFLFQEAVECYNLISSFKKNSINNVHYFSIFERDANLCAYLLMKSKIYVNKIPSEVPLFIYNSTIVADKLSFCFAYQKEEFECFKDTMFVNETQDWCPELIFNAPQRFFQARKKVESERFSYDLGFYSSGNWLRKMLGDAELETNDAENELIIIKKLVEISEKNNLNLRVYCHPIEKRNPEKTMSFYAQFKSSSFSLAAFNKSSIEEFDEVNIAVSLLSTLMYERIYFGFKTLLVPLGFDGFPLQNSGLSNICVKSIYDLEGMILKSKSISTKEFFTTNKISNYTTII